MYLYYFIYIIYSLVGNLSKKVFIVIIIIHNLPYSIVLVDRFKCSPFQNRFIIIIIIIIIIYFFYFLDLTDLMCKCNSFFKNVYVIIWPLDYNVQYRGNGSRKTREWICKMLQARLEAVFLIWASLLSLL